MLRKQVLNLENISEVVNQFKEPNHLAGQTNLVNNESNKIRSVSSNNMVKSLPLRVIFNKDIDTANLEKLKQIFAKFTGKSKVIFKIQQNNKTKILETAFRVNHNASLTKELLDNFKDMITIET